MGFKRKLSDLEIDASPSSTISSSTYSRDSLSPSPAQDAFTFQSQSHYPSPQFSWPSTEQQRCSNASGRTRKRYRDNRPDEQAIYASTFRKLFAAQRPRQHQPSALEHRAQLAPPTALPVAMDVSEASTEQMHVEPASQQQPKSQSSLHKFFNISRAPVSNTMPTTQMVFRDSRTQCQDCEACVGQDGDDVMMDEGCGDWSSAWACQRCSRVVCDLCAVVNVGMGRECLMCRTS